MSRRPDGGTVFTLEKDLLTGWLFPTYLLERHDASDNNCTNPTTYGQARPNKPVDLLGFPGEFFPGPAFLGFASERLATVIYEGLRLEPHSSVRLPPPLYSKPGNLCDGWPIYVFVYPVIHAIGHIYIVDLRDMNSSPCAKRSNSRFHDDTRIYTA